jgi:phenylalanyl-tRNA synthetase beta chain
MVSLSLNKKRLFDELKVKDPAQFAGHLGELGVEVETDGPEEIVVDITPNRPDRLSQAGFTRSVAAYLGTAPGLKRYETTPSKLKVIVDESVRDVRPYTACAVVRNLKLDEERLKEIIDMQEKLHITFCRKRKRAAIGVYPMEAISGKITYKALDADNVRFRPLESDREMSGKEILEKHPKGREYAHLLNGLAKYPLFVDAKGSVLSMPPIINSHETGKITMETTEMFLESSGSDFRICHEIMQMMCAALADMGATIHTVEIVYGRKSEHTPDMAPKRQEFYGYYVNRRLGTDVRKEQFAPLLARMGLGFEEGRTKETYYALIPPYRVDFLHQIDVVEDIAIAYGYNNIRAELPKLATVGLEANETKFARIVRHVLAGHGLLEAKNYHLLSGAYQRSLGAQDIVTLRSSVSEEYDALRADLLGGLLLALSRNKTHEYPQRLFEIGSVFAPGKEGVLEEQHLAIVLAGDADYTRARQLVDALFAALGLEGSYSPDPDGRFMAGRCARLVVEGVSAGVVGEVAPQHLETAQLAVPVAACELDLGALRALIVRRAS